MGVSAITIQKDIILEALRGTARGEWKILVLDGESRRLLDSVIKEDDILQENVTNIEQIEQKRPMNPEMDALYFLSPQPHIVECLMADLEYHRYRRSHLLWTAPLQPELKARIEKSAQSRPQIVSDQILNIDFFPRESHLITFRDPWSFPILFHPTCDQLVRKHMDDLALKIVSVCVSLGEYPTIRYYNPRKPLHEASVLCSHLARFAQLELDHYAKQHDDFPPQSPRPRGVLIITDRTMDLFAPIVHEFTYQAMVHDLLPIVERDKTLYKTVVNKGGVNEEVKEIEIAGEDKIWVENRHMHMKDLLEKLVNDFNTFRAQNPQFAENSQNTNSINNIKDMLAGLPQFQEGKEAYSLHLGMAQDCMNVFQERRLADVASVEQSLATGLDEDYKKPKNMTDQVVRLLDDDSITFPERLRLIIEYLLYRNGLLYSDIQKLLAHARLPIRDGEVIQNLEILGARVTRPLKDTTPLYQPLFGLVQNPPPANEQLGLSRFDPALKPLLENQIRGTLDQAVFPFTKPQLDSAEGLIGAESVSQASLRSAKPTWARTRSSALEPRQRIIVFMAGGATYSESRACYDVGQRLNKDIFLTTSHMLSPSLFLRQVGDLSVDRRRLDLPADRPKPKAPAHLFERDPPPQPKTQPVHPSSRQQHQQPPTVAFSAMNVNGNGHPLDRPINGVSAGQPVPMAAKSEPRPPENSKLQKDPGKKKKHGLFHLKKDK